MDRLERAFLDLKRNELLGPVQAMGDISRRVLDDDGGADTVPGFLDDMRRVLSSAETLRVSIHNVLGPASGPSSDAPLDFDAIKSHLRHEMLNLLNPVINYSEMWLEETDIRALEPFRPDLEALLRLGRTTHTLIDAILGSFDLTDTGPRGHDDEFRDFRERFHNLEETFAVTPRQAGRLLVVDDNATNRDILRRLLESLGHTIVCAAGGEEALTLLETVDVDAILLDLVMPDMNGFAVLYHLKRDPELRSLPVIMISALNETDYVVKCLELGAEDYLSRPYNSALLKARIDASLEKKRLREREVEYLRRIEDERRKSEALLQVILPQPIIEELKRTGVVVPRRHEDVAVMFADLVGFTKYCDRHTPEMVVYYLQDLVEAWEESALKHGVQKIKTIGDAFMAASGLMAPSENPVLDCVRCGLEMIQAVKDLPTAWNVRVGIHVGRVVAGVLGRRQYLFDVFGDAVNTASRMESSGVPGKIALSASAWGRIDHLAEGTNLGQVVVKGKGEMPMFCFERFKTGRG